MALDPHVVAIDQVNETMGQLTTTVGNLTRASIEQGAEMKSLRRDVESISCHFTDNGESMPTRMALFQQELEGISEWMERFRQRKSEEEARQEEDARQMRNLRWGVASTAALCLITLTAAVIVRVP